MPKVKVLIAEDHTVVAEGLEALLRDEFDLVGIVHDGRALLDAVESLHPDVIVTDISMPLLNGLDAIRQIRSRRPDAKVVVLTMHRETELAADAFRAGASGYVFKSFTWRRIDGGDSARRGGTSLRNIPFSQRSDHLIDRSR